MKANFEKGTKICSKCKKELPIDHFQKDKSKSDGLNTRCKDCVAEYRKSPRGKEVLHQKQDENIIKQKRVKNVKDVLLKNFKKQNTEKRFIKELRRNTEDQNKGFDMNSNAENQMLIRKCD